MKNKTEVNFLLVRNAIELNAFRKLFPGIIATAILSLIAVVLMLCGGVGYWVLHSLDSKECNTLILLSFPFILLVGIVRIFHINPIRKILKQQLSEIKESFDWAEDAKQEPTFFLKKSMEEFYVIK